MAASQSCEFSLRRLGTARIRAFLESQKDLPLTYEPTGMIDGPAPPGFLPDRNGTTLGSGRAVFEAACAALRQWKMFDLGWIELCTFDAEPRAGNVVAVLVHRCGVWSLNSCRVLRVIDEPGDGRAPSRYGLIYGTLPGHCECGEERFLIEWNHAHNTVRFEIFAYSRLRHPLVRWARPLIRRFQKQFGREAPAALRRAVERGVESR